MHAGMLLLRTSAEDADAAAVDSAPGDDQGVGASSVASGRSLLLAINPETGKVGVASKLRNPFCSRSAFFLFPLTMDNIWVISAADFLECLIGADIRPRPASASV